MFQLLKYFDNFDNFTSHSMSLLSSTRKFGSKGLTLSTSNLDIMKNSSHRGKYPAMQSNGPLPQVDVLIYQVCSNCNQYLGSPPTPMMQRRPVSAIYSQARMIKVYINLFEEEYKCAQ